MRDYISDKRTFEEIKQKVALIFSQKPFEQNPFNERFKYFLAFEFDFIYDDDFFEGLKVFLKKIGNRRMWFYTIEPSPEDYFFRRYGKYSVLEFTTMTTISDVNFMMTQPPTDKRYDSVVTTSNYICWFSNSEKWALLGNRFWEIAIVGFTDLRIKKIFKRSFSEPAQSMFGTVQTQAEIVDEMLKFNEKIKNEYQKMVENYNDR